MSLSFTCNICATLNTIDSPDHLQREAPSCVQCESNVRFRWIVHSISTALFGKSLLLQDFPESREVRGLGFSDVPRYADVLAAKFDFTNTFYDEEPFFDITDPTCGESASYDFIIASEVFEHIEPPVQVAFDNLARLLKPDGAIIFSTPWKQDGKTIERFPNLHSWELIRFKDRQVLVNKTDTGRFEVFDNLVFHGGSGHTLEMRLFSQPDLEKHFAAAGLQATFVSEPFLEFGINFREPWSLPCLLSKHPLSNAVHLPVSQLDKESNELRAAHRKLSALHEVLAKRTDSLNIVTEQLALVEAELDNEKAKRESLAAERQQVAASKWLRLGRLLNLGPRLP